MTLRFSVISTPCNGILISTQNVQKGVQNAGHCAALRAPMCTLNLGPAFEAVVEREALDWVSSSSSLL